MRVVTRNRSLSMRRCCCCFALSVLLLSSLYADKSFPHSAVGKNQSATGTIEAKARLVIAFAKGYSSPKLQGPAKGTLQFYDTEGNLQPLTVRSKDAPDYNGKTVTEFSFVLGTGQSQSFELENPAQTLTTFWAEIKETEGSVTGKIDFTLEQNGEKATTLSAFAAERSIVNLAAGATVNGNQHTGLAIANPTSREVVYSVVAVDPNGVAIAQAEHKLRARGQIAAFAEELFPELATGFSGSLVVYSDSGLSVLALNQEGIKLSSVQTVAGEAAQVSTSVAAGYVADLMKSQGGSSSSPTVTSALLPVTTGKVIFRKGAVTHEAPISPDGAYYFGSLEAGEWEISVQAPGYHEMIQKVVYPRPTLNRLLVPKQTELGWLRQTLTDQTIIKPLQQFRFYFQKGPSPTNTTRAAADIFKLWAEYELPGLGIEVEGTPSILGGTVQESGLPAPLTPYTVIVKPDPTVTGSVVATDFVSSTSEARGGYIRFDPACQGCLPQLARQLWKTVFALRESPQLPPGWSPLLTQMTPESTYHSPTALDRLYWRVIRFRPLGTKVTTDSRELLPILLPEGGN